VRRGLFNLTAVVSMVLCLTMTAAIIVQWVRSTRGGEIVARNTIRIGADSITLINRRAWSTPGTLDLDWSAETTSGYSSIGATPHSTWVHSRHDGDHAHLTRVGGDAPAWLVRLGLNWAIRSSPPGGAGRNAQSSFWWVQVRYPFLLVLAIAADSVLATALWRIIRRQRRRLGGLCLTCGYDLRATPDRCPECGAEAKPHAAKGAAA